MSSLQDFMAAENDTESQLTEAGVQAALEQLMKQPGPSGVIIDRRELDDGA